MAAAAEAVPGPGRAGWRAAVRERAEQRWLARRFTLTWGLLVLNVLTFEPKTSLIPVPDSLGKVITQGSLGAALILALSLNPRGVIRKSAFLSLIALLATETLFTLPDAQYLRGTGFRTVRFAVFVFVIALLSPHWGRRDLLLPGAHLRVMGWIVGELALGILIAPGHALGNHGRLQGILWPMPSTQAAHYSAIVLGMTAICWFCGKCGGRLALATVLLTAVLLLLSHTRTALGACVAGLAVAGLSLVAVNSRARRLFLGLAVAAATAAITAPAVIISWLERGQSSNGQLASLSGRTGFWSAVLAYPRDPFRMIFGFGVSNGTFGGLPIDSNWILSYQDQGIFGVTVCALILIFLLIAALFETRPLNRAVALFLIVYCLVASFTEVGFTGASPYTLDLVVAASLLVPGNGEVRGLHRRIFHVNRLVRA